MATHSSTLAQKMDGGNENAPPAMDGGAWQAAVHGFAKSQTRLSDFTFTFHFHVLEKEIATTPVFLPGECQGDREPGGLPSMGSHRVGHD